MEIRLLEYFMAVCEELHFTRAAERLGISQPTLSQQIKLLEDRLDTQLFKRNGRKIHVTEAGQILLTHTQQIFQELRKAELEIRELKGFQRGRLTIGCAGSHLLHTSILSFHNQYPKIEISVHDNTTDETVKNVLNNKYDLGVVFLPIEEKKLIAKRIFSSELTVVVGEDHKLADKSSIKLDQIKEEPIFLLQKNYLVRKEFDSFCEELGLSLKPIMELSDMYSLLEMTIYNHGITILPKSYANNMKNYKIKTLKIQDEIPIKEVGVIYRKDSMNPIAKTFVEYLLENYNVVTF